VLSALDIKVKRILWGLAAEFAYLAVVGTTIVPPCSLLKRRVSRVVSPEVLSFLAAKLGGDDPEVRLNSMLGMRLSGVPKCEILNGTLPELYELCTALRRCTKRVKLLSPWRSLPQQPDMKRARCY